MNYTPLPQLVADCFDLVKSRDIVIRYQGICEIEFERFIKELHQEASCLSTAQINDSQKEHFPALPEVTERFFYNTIQLVREREDLQRRLKQAIRLQRER